MRHNTPMLLIPEVIRRLRRRGVRASRAAVHRRLAVSDVRALIRSHGGGIRGPRRGGFAGIWEIPDVPEVLEALKPRRRGRPRNS